VNRLSALALLAVAPLIASHVALGQEAQPTLAPLPPALPRTHAPQPTKPAISAEDLKTRLYIFSDDSMQGREVGTIGNVKGTDYIAAEARKIGLQPAGDNGTYFQTIPLVEKSISPNTALTVDNQPLVLGTDFIPVGSTPVNLKNTQVIYAGHLGDFEQVTPAQIAGKIVVYAPPSEAASRERRELRPVIDGAAAVFFLALDQTPPSVRAAAIKPRVSRPEDEQQPQGPQPAVVYLTLGAGAKLFTAPLDSLKVGTPGKSVTLTYTQLSQPAPYPGRNVVGIIPGSDPKLRNEYVAIGAHNDHIGTHGPALDHDSVRAYNHYALISGADSHRIDPTPAQWTDINGALMKLRQQNPPRPDSIFNGADDDGSGTVSVLEIAQYIASLKTKPKRSILFVWHTGEEKGLWGSIYFTDHPTVPRDSIVTQLNIDMIGRGDAADIAGGNPNYLQLIGSRRLSTELGDLIETVNRNDKHNLQFDYSFDANGHPAQIYCRSDHYSYARYGIPITFFTTGLHPDYHQLTDEPEYIDYDHMARVATLISDIAIHVADLDHRPVVDKPKPDPHARCVQ
jgi:Zn-dependent M28 family amino/carboxypeptidase